MLRFSPALPPIVPILRSLLAALGFEPAALPHLRSLSPALLLDLLSAILGQPLPLSPRSSRSASDDDAREELETVKLVVGVLSMSANLEMSSLEPRRAVERHTAELLVLARATVLVAVEHGWDGSSTIWQGKVLRRLAKRRPARAANRAASSASVSFTTPPPSDLPLPIEPSFSPIRHSTPPPPSHSLGQERLAVASGSSLSSSPPQSAPSQSVDCWPLGPVRDPSVPTRASLTLETDPITRFTAPKVWRRRLDDERSALRDCLASLDH
jgi:hypothetical protein